MSDFVELSLIMLAVFAPIFVIIFIKSYFRYKQTVSLELSKIRKDLDLKNIDEVVDQNLKLQRRIEVLEKIVTDKGYEVNEEITDLK